METPQFPTRGRPRRCERSSTTASPVRRRGRRAPCVPTFSSADRGVEHGASRVESPAHPRVERLGLRARARRRGERRGMADQSVWASADVRWCGTCGNCDKCRSVHSVFTCGTCWRRFGVQPPNGKCPYDGGAVTIGTHNKPNNWWGPFAGDELRLKQRNRVRHTYTWDDDAKKMDGVPRDLRSGQVARHAPSPEPRATRTQPRLPELVAVLNRRRLCAGYRGLIGTRAASAASPHRELLQRQATLGETLGSSGGRWASRSRASSCASEARPAGLTAAARRFLPL